MPVQEKKHRLPGDCYIGQISVFFTLCVKDRIPIVVGPDIVNAFIEIIKEVAEKYSCIIPAYCFTPDHIHLIASGVEEDADILQFLSAYKQKTGFWMSRNRVKAKWQNISMTT